MKKTFEKEGCGEAETGNLKTGKLFFLSLNFIFSRKL